MSVMPFDFQSLIRYRNCLTPAPMYNTLIYISIMSIICVIPIIVPIFIVLKLKYMFQGTTGQCAKYMFQGTAATTTACKIIGLRHLDSLLH
jgi:hypothetical protein